MNNIAIRADGGSIVGMGHIMRCLALAEQLKGMGARVYFISRYDEGREKVRSSGFEAFMLKFDTDISAESTSAGFNYGNENELEADLGQTKRIIDQHGCDLLVIDKYNLNAGYFDQIKKWGITAAFIDDLNLFKCSADIIINGNINAVSLSYERVFDKQKLLLGNKYTILRSEFGDIGVREVRSPRDISCIPEILVTTGGSDPYNCTEKIIRILLDNSNTANFRLNVIVGPGFIYADRIQDLSKEYKNIELYINHDCISEVMLKSDIAISSGGSTLYELCCCGTPTLAFIMAENQKGIVETLDSNRCIRSLGWYTELENTNLDNIVFDMILDIETRRTYSQQMQRLVDGRGASRIAQEILSMASR